MGRSKRVIKPTEKAIISDTTALPKRPRGRPRKVPLVSRVSSRVMTLLTDFQAPVEEETMASPEMPPADSLDGALKEPLKLPKV